MTSRRPTEVPPFSPRLLTFFVAYLRPYFRRHFEALRLSRGGGAPADHRATPLVIYSNHPSWWDALVYMVLCHTLFPGREGYAPMDADMLAKFRFFRRLGAFPIEAGTRRGAATFLRIAETALRRPGAILWLTAEGAFRDPRERPLRLARGLAHLARRLPRLTVLPLALEYPFWDQRLPQALARFGPAIAAGREHGRDVDAWQESFETALERTMDALGGEARARDPEAFETLIAGRRGVGGVYDLWRRLRPSSLPERDP